MVHMSLQHYQSLPVRSFCLQHYHIIPVTRLQWEHLFILLQSQIPTIRSGQTTRQICKRSYRGTTLTAKEAELMLTTCMVRVSTTKAVDIARRIPLVFTEDTSVFLTSTALLVGLWVVIFSQHVDHGSCDRVITGMRNFPIWVIFVMCHWQFSMSHYLDNMHTSAPVVSQVRAHPLFCSVLIWASAAIFHENRQTVHKMKAGFDVALWQKLYLQLQHLNLVAAF